MEYKDKGDHIIRGKASDYGRAYYCVKTHLNEEHGEIFVYADQVQFSPEGSVAFVSKGMCNLAIAAGQWTAIYSAAMMDGVPLAVQHWLPKP